MNLKNVLNQIKYEPKIELKEKIWLKISTRGKYITYIKLISFSFISITSVACFIPMFKVLINDFTQSGFYEYLSLAFSNGGLFSSYWKEFVYSLLESLPTLSIMYSLTIIFIFFLSLKYITKQIITNNYIALHKCDIA